ncbi:molybdenum cofactor biosysynthesis protein [Skermanella stibiiresistens SB22]|uniref:Molybdenum cofactor biosysynthesis protein n=1 Tax=Skermanella stibiiresistens SB22 TaxID=1385369 RepID=W9GVT8_9PROT|nr:molybdenum cofactor biosysynthesis protein [Skermanella stibiiresistens SB22]
MAVSLGTGHHFSKPVQDKVTLLAGLGVEGDAHMGATDQHLFHKRKNPDQPNLRQVHLIHAELLDTVAAAGFTVGPGELGENVTTRGVDLLGLPTGTRLRLGGEAVIEVTGLRNPCVQIDRYQKGLQKQLMDKDAEGRLIRKSGVMAIVLTGGVVHPGDVIQVDLPPEPHRALEPV